MVSTLISGNPYGLSGFNLQKFPIRDEKIEKYLNGNNWRGEPTPIAFNVQDTHIGVRARDLSFFIEQMPSNCGALILSCIEDGHAGAITFLAKNIASFLGDKVLFLSCTDGRAPDFVDEGWTAKHVAYSARYYGYKMHYMFLTLEEDDRMVTEWTGDHIDDDDDYDDEPYYDDE